MNAPSHEQPAAMDQTVEASAPEFGLTRRGFVQVFGAGLLIAVGGDVAQAQRPGRRGGGRRGGFFGTGATSIEARVHIGRDGTLTVLTGKVEAGQGARAELTEAAAEELRVPVARVQLVMADTGACPDDGITAGSGTTPRTVPAVREGCAAARILLATWAAQQWGVEPNAVAVIDGVASHNGHKASYADLAASPDAAQMLKQPLRPDTVVTPVKEWTVMGTPLARPNGRDVVTGRHAYPSDVIRPGMLYGKVLRPASYGANLLSVDLAPAKAMADVVATRDEAFVAVAAPTSFAAQQAIDAIAAAAKWEPVEQPSSDTLYQHLRQHATGDVKNPFADELAKSAKRFKQTYEVRIRSARPAGAARRGGRVGRQQIDRLDWHAKPVRRPRRPRPRLQPPSRQVRVIACDFGGGFGGKHTGECPSKPHASPRRRANPSAFAGRARRSSPGPTSAPRA